MFGTVVDFAVAQLMQKIQNALCVGPVAEDTDWSGLINILRSIFFTVAEMKCQRGSYEIEFPEKRPVFNEAFMKDLDEGKERIFMEGGESSIRIVVSPGIVKRPHFRAPEIVGRVSKMRIM